jgi:hypothetical protein
LRLIDLNVCSRLAAAAYFSFVISTSAPAQPVSDSLDVYQRLLDARRSFHVLSVALSPGQEDLEALAYLRHGLGAKILSVYVTHGESRMSEEGDVYPAQVAARRTMEAWRALTRFGGEARFLTFTDPGGTRDTQYVRAFWPEDSLQGLLMQEISDFKPELILLASDYGKFDTPKLQVLKHDLLAAIHEIDSDIALTRHAPPKAAAWKVHMMLAEVGEHMGETLWEFPTERMHPILWLSYAALGKQAAAEYKSIARFRDSWALGPQRKYQPVHFSELRLSLSEQGRAVTPLPPRLARLDRMVARELDRLTKLFRSGTLSRKQNVASSLPRVTAIIDSVELELKNRLRLRPNERKILLGWKDEFRMLKASLLGVKVDLVFSETVLAPRQLTLLTVRLAEGVPKTGTTELYFPDAELAGWILNEADQSRISFAPGVPYRLVSPRELQFDLPLSVNGVRKHRYGTPFRIVLQHKAPRPQESFEWETTQLLQFAPLFSVNVVTPVVSAWSGEAVVVEVQNHSRDPVTDRLFIDHELVRATGARFTLDKQQGIFVDSLKLEWHQTPDVGEYIVPIRIGPYTMGHFGVRSFRTVVDSTRPVAVLSTMPASPLVQSLRRLGLSPTVCSDPTDLERVLNGAAVAILDEEARSPLSLLNTDVLKSFVLKGGHLVGINQDPMDDSHLQKVFDLAVSRTDLFDPYQEVRADTVHPIFRTPNTITDRSWKGWIYYRASDSVKDASQTWNILASLSDVNEPVVLSKNAGSGTLTYVNLALSSQLLNIHEGALDLLANIVSYQRNP